MMDDQQQKLFGLMAVAEDQQKAVQTALEGLAIERVALAGIADEVRKAAAEAVPAMQRAAGEAVSVSVKQSLVRASEAAVQALAEAAQPVIGSLSNVVDAAHDVEGSMRRAGAWFAWKWVAVAAGGLLGVCTLAYMSLAWQLHQVQSLGHQKAALQMEVTELQTQAEDWAKRAGRAKLGTCGKKSRLCVRVEKAEIYGDGSDYFILKGY